MGDIEIEPSSTFIQSPEHRPKYSIIIAEGIPLIDLDYVPHLAYFHYQVAKL